MANLFTDAIQKFNMWTNPIFQRPQSALGAINVLGSAGVHILHPSGASAQEPTTAPGYGQSIRLTDPLEEAQAAMATRRRYGTSNTSGGAGGGGDVSDDGGGGGSGGGQSEQDALNAIFQPTADYLGQLEAEYRSRQSSQSATILTTGRYQ